MKISEYTRSGVIQAWLMGKTREKIASEFYISTGTVSNIIDQWRNVIGSYDADSLRELALGLKKAGATPPQSLDGLRILNFINQLGIDENHIHDFLNKLCKGCKDQRVEPHEVAKLLKQMIAFPEVNSIKDIPTYIKKRSREKIELAMDIYYAKLEIENLNREKERKKKEIQNLQNDLESFKERNRNEQKDFLLFKEVKIDLEKNNISIHNLEEFQSIIRIFKDDFNFQPIKILCEFSDIQKFRYQRDNKKTELKELDSKIQNQKELVDRYQKYLSQFQIEEATLSDLENMEFNLTDFKNLYLVLQEIAKRHQISKKEVKTKFFKFLDKFKNLFLVEKEIMEKIDMNYHLDDEILSRRNIIKTQPELFSVLKCLLDRGFNEYNILLIFDIIKKDYLNQIPIDLKTYLECLSKDLDKYKTIKDVLKSLDIEILLKKSKIDRLSVDRDNLERKPQIHNCL